MTWLLLSAPVVVALGLIWHERRRARRNARIDARLAVMQERAARARLRPFGGHVDVFPSHVPPTSTNGRR